MSDEELTNIFNEVGILVDEKITFSKFCEILDIYGSNSGY